MHRSAFRHRLERLARRSAVVHVERPREGDGVALKRKRLEIWEETIEWPLGDIDAAQRIRDICRSAAESAEKAGSQSQPDKKSQQYRERYQGAAKAAMEIAIKISDDLMLDASVREIVELCMKANDLRTARILLRAIQSASIGEDALNAHPMLRE